MDSRDLILILTLPLASCITMDMLLLLGLSFFICACFSISSLQVRVEPAPSTEAFSDEACRINTLSEVELETVAVAHLILCQKSLVYDLLLSGAILFSLSAMNLPEEEMGSKEEELGGKGASTLCLRDTLMF